MSNNTIILGDDLRNTIDLDLFPMSLSSCKKNLYMLEIQVMSMFSKHVVTVPYHLSSPSDPVIVRLNPREVYSITVTVNPNSLYSSQVPMIVLRYRIDHLILFNLLAKLL